VNIAIVTAEAEVLETLRRILRSAAEYQVVWVARDTAEAVANCAQQPPDLMLLGMNGQPATAVETVRRIMQQVPCPILLVVQSIEENSGPIFEAIGAGALDVISTPLDADLTLPAGTALLNKLGMLLKLKWGEAENVAVPVKKPPRPDQLVLLGASAGGPTALASVLSAFPEDFAAPVIIVQHIDAQFVGPMATWLMQQGSLPVRIARARDELTPGTVYMAGRSDHLVLLDRYTLGYRAEPRQLAYRPSIDELFFSVDRFWKTGVIAALLTGMGQDGAAGLRLLRDAGALTLTQNRETSVVYGIPKAAARLNAAVEVLPLNRIGPRIREAVRSFNYQRHD